MKNTLRRKLLLEAKNICFAHLLENTLNNSIPIGLREHITVRVDCPDSECACDEALMKISLLRLLKLMAKALPDGTPAIIELRTCGCALVCEFRLHGAWLVQNPIALAGRGMRLPMGIIRKHRGRLHTEQDGDTFRMALWLPLTIKGDAA